MSPPSDIVTAVCIATLITMLLADWLGDFDPPQELPAEGAAAAAV